MDELLVHRVDAGARLPERAHPGDAGLDLFASSEVALAPGERAVVATGIAVAIPPGYAGFVQPRSGAAARHGLGLVNSPGLIDSGYRGELKVILINLDRRETIRIGRGDKIAQLVVLPVPEVAVREVNGLPESERGRRGFGSSGS